MINVFAYFAYIGRMGSLGSKALFALALLQNLLLVSSASANPTSRVIISGSVDANVPQLNAPSSPTFADLNSTNQGHVQISIVDSNGNIHLGNVYLYMAFPFAQVFLILVYVDAGESGGASGTPREISSELIGVFSPPITPVLTESIPWTGANSQVLQIDYSGLTGNFGNGTTMTSSSIPAGDFTTKVILTTNLSANAGLTTGIDASSFAQLAASSQYSYSVDVADGLKNRHTVRIYNFHTSENHWTIRGYLDGGDLIGGAAGLPQQIFSTDITFVNAGYGLQLGPSVLSDSIHWNTGATENTIIFFFNPVTQIGAPSTVLTFVEPELLPAPGNCSILRSCLSTALDNAMNSCQELATQCAATPVRYAVTAEQLASRAVAQAGCANKTQPAACRRCYQHAIRTLKRGKDQELFYGLLAEAQGLISAEATTRCPAGTRH